MRCVSALALEKCFWAGVKNILESCLKNSVSNPPSLSRATISADKKVIFPSISCGECGFAWRVYPLN